MSLSHSPACFGSHEPTSGTSFYNSNHFSTCLLDKEIKITDQKKIVEKERAPPHIKNGYISRILADKRSTLLRF